MPDRDPAAASAVDAADILLLYPGGYPLHIDVASASVAGAGTAMRFTLPLHGHNFPLLHTREHKLVVALAGQLRLRAGDQTLARLDTGQAVLVPPATVHRIAQLGAEAAVAGVVLWPGAVETAFRRMAALAHARGFDRAAVIALLAEYGVRWTGATGLQQESAAAVALAVGDFDSVAAALPPPLRAAVDIAWRGWLEGVGG